MIEYNANHRPEYARILSKYEHDPKGIVYKWISSGDGKGGEIFYLTIKETIKYLYSLSGVQNSYHTPDHRVEKINCVIELLMMKIKIEHTE